mgnify:CR=1 FL=1
MRKSGMLMPVSALPGAYGIGCFSKEAYEFVDRLEEAGFERAVVIVTQDRSYEKKPYEFMPAARARYADYPYLLEAIETRHDRYNIQRMHLWQYEREGRALVVAPQKPVEVGHVEHDPAKLLDLYIQGRQEAKRLLGDIEAFVER